MNLECLRFRGGGIFVDASVAEGIGLNKIDIPTACAEGICVSCDDISAVGRLFYRITLSWVISSKPRLSSKRIGFY